MVVIQLYAEGTQIDPCADGTLAWKLREPIATLMRDDKTVGRHLAGPTWEADDASVVIGKVAAQVPGETAAGRRAPRQALLGDFVFPGP